MEEIFDQYQVVSRAVISVTRNADISPEDEDYDVNDDYRQHMRKVLKKRSRLAPVRLEIQGAASDALVEYLCQRLELTPPRSSALSLPWSSATSTLWRGCCPRRAKPLCAILPSPPRHPPA